MILGVHSPPVSLLVGIALGDLVQHLIEGKTLRVLPADRAVLRLPSRARALLSEVTAAEHHVPDRVFPGSSNRLAVNLQGLAKEAIVAEPDPLGDVAEQSAV